MPPKRVLVIDDERGFHDMFRFILEPLGFNVESAYNGEEGLGMAQAASYDLIFCDNHMPKMNGDEVLGRLPAAKAALFVMMMGSDSDPDRQGEGKAREMGARHCLHKPFEVEELTAVVETVLGIKM